MGAVSLDFLPQFQVRVKLRRTQWEQMFSGLPLIADIAQCGWHVSNVPKAEATDVTPEVRRYARRAG